MGVYLNSTNAYTLYKGETTKPYFVFGIYHDNRRTFQRVFWLYRN